jgi:hypothetical protein
MTPSCQASHADSAYRCARRAEPAPRRRWRQTASPDRSSAFHSSPAPLAVDRSLSIGHCQSVWRQVKTAGKASTPPPPNIAASPTEKLEPQPRDLMHLGQRGGEFGCRGSLSIRAAKAARMARPVEPRTAMMKGVAKTHAIAVIQIGKAGEFIRRAASRPRRPAPSWNSTDSPPAMASLPASSGMARRSASWRHVRPPRQWPAFVRQR